MIALRCLQIPNTGPYQRIFERWSAEEFSNGAISPSRVTTAITKLAALLWLRVFIESATPSTHLENCLKKKPFRLDGLNTWGGLVGRKVAHQVKLLYPGAEEISLDQTTKALVVFGLREFGEISIQNKPDIPTMPGAWLLDKSFQRRLLKINGTANAKTSLLYALASAWDTYIMPLRFFSNEAALEWLRYWAATAAPGYVLRSKLETFKKDLRGKRALQLSRGLSQDRPPIVTYWGDKEVWFNPDALRAHKFGLHPISEYEKAWAPRRVLKRGGTL